MKLPIPDPLYPCAHCAEDYSWPAKDLDWCAEIQNWVCPPCWEYKAYDYDTKGPTLAEEILSQQKENQGL
jgi:hypothetical protein